MFKKSEENDIASYLY